MPPRRRPTTKYIGRHNNQDKINLGSRLQVIIMVTVMVADTDMDADIIVECGNRSFIKLLKIREGQNSLPRIFIYF